MQLHLKLRSIIDEKEALVETYESRIKEMKKEHHEDKIETSKHYMEQMGLIKLELHAGVTAQNMMMD